MSDSASIEKSDDTVPKRILAWSENRPLWQRDALRRIVLNGYPDEEAFEELLALCKKEHGDQTVTLAAKPLSKDHLPVDPGAGESISLSSIANVSGVNQLATGQTLNFEESGLTIVYGQNGTGKPVTARLCTSSPVETEQLPVHVFTGCARASSLISAKQYLTIGAIAKGMRLNGTEPGMIVEVENLARLDCALYYGTHGATLSLVATDRLDCP